MSTLKVNSIEASTGTEVDINATLGTIPGIVISGVTTVAAGSASAPAITPSGDNNTGIFFPSADTIAFAEGGTEVARIDSSGRLGIGITNPDSLLHLKSTTGNVRHTIEVPDTYQAFTNYSAANSEFSIGYIRNSGTDHSFRFCAADGLSSGEIMRIDSVNSRIGIGITNCQSALALASGQGITWGASNYPSINGSNTTNTLTFSTQATERARIDSSGNVGIGTNNPADLLHLEKNGDVYLRVRNSSTNINAYLGQDSNGTYIGNTGASVVRFIQGASERGRFGTAGSFGVVNASDTIWVAATTGAGTTYAAYVVTHSATSSTPFSGTVCYKVYTNGNVQNTNNSYTVLSDAKLKENVVDANSQWDDIKAIKIRNWNFKAETGHETHKQIGPIAQELEQICPGLVFDTPDRDAEGNNLGTVTKGINSSVLYMKAIKALQEAQIRIEQLEAKVAALEAQ